MAYETVGYTEGAGKTIASDNVGGSSFQRVKIAHGAEGAATDASAANPLPVTGPLTNTQLRASAVSVAQADNTVGTAFGPITTAGTVLFTAIDTSGFNSIILQLTGYWAGSISFQISQDGTNWTAQQGYSWNSDVVLAESALGPDVYVLPTTARYFRAVTSSDFSGSVSGTYVGRGSYEPNPYQSVKLMDVDAGLMFPVAGRDQNGNVVRLAVNTAGQVLPADNLPIFGVAAKATTVVAFDTTGYNSVALQLVGTFSATVSFQCSNDGNTWSALAGWSMAGAAGPANSSTTTGFWLFPAAGKFFRAQVTAYTSGSVVGIAYLQNQNAFNPASSPSIAANSSVNIGQIGATNVVTGGVAGIQAIGGNIAVGAAPTANPVPVGGWDGTNTRRILTDAVSGGVALGANAALNGLSSGTLISAASNNLTQIKATAGKFHMLHAINTNAAARYLKVFFLPSASVTMGTTTPTLNFLLPPNSATPLVLQDPLGVSHAGGTGLTIAIVTGQALLDNTAAGAGDVVLNYSFV